MASHTQHHAACPGSLAVLCDSTHHLCSVGCACDCSQYSDLLCRSVSCREWQPRQVAWLACRCMQLLDYFWMLAALMVKGTVLPCGLSAGSCSALSLYTDK